MAPSAPQELTDPAEVKRLFAQGVLQLRAVAVSPEAVQRTLDWTYELAAAGAAIPAIALVGDFGHMTLNIDALTQGEAAKPSASMPSALVRAYEDYVLGKLYSDLSFERAGDAIRRFQGHDRIKGLGYLLTRFVERTGVDAVHVNPATLKSLAQTPINELMEFGAQSLATDGPAPLVLRLTENLVQLFRDLGEVVAATDVFELESGVALAQYGERMVLRRILETANDFEARLPRMRTRVAQRRYDTPTQILDEDYYPIGGYTSISTRGTIESLLHSQLAYMEKDERPDLFDVKFLRDELYYYARDENQFLRRRQTFCIALAADLATAKYKDDRLPLAPLNLGLAVVVAFIRKAIEWLSADALTFELLFLGPTEKGPLAPEMALLKLLFHEQIDNGTVSIDAMAPGDLAPHLLARSRRSLTHLLSLTAADVSIEAANVQRAQLVVESPQPRLKFFNDPPVVWGEEGEELAPLDPWFMALETLLDEWA